MRIVGLWRFPVKSLAGEQLDTVTLTERGVHADRLWALHDVERDVTVTARRLSSTLLLRARYAAEPAPDAGPGNAPSVIITLPDGTELHSDDPRIDAALSESLDHDVRLVSLPTERRAFRMSMRERIAAARGLTRDLGISHDEPLPKLSDMDARTLATLTRNATPPGAFYDLCPVHLLTTSSLATLGAYTGDTPDPRRFRPNVLVDGAPDGLPEADWAGSTIRLGDARLHVVMKTVRCVVPSRAHADVPEVERALTKAVLAVGDRYLGAYADVTSGGRIAVGDAITVSPPREPGVAGRTLSAARRTALDTLNTIAEIPRRR